MQQARKRGGEEAGSTGPDEFEVKVHPLRMVPFIMILIIVPSYCLWLGRQEIFDAIGGARAYVYTSLLSTVTEVPVTEMPEDLVTQPKIDMAEPRVVTQTTVITEIVLKDGSKMQILDEPIPNDCYPEQHADYDGYAVQWGLGNKVKSAAECCRRCKEFVPSQEVPHGCNVWIWCGDPSGVCWTMDIHNHTTGDCWLKFQAGWDGITNRAATNLKVNHRHKFSEQFRSEHKSAPELIPWVAGLVQTPKPAAAGP